MSEVTILFVGGVAKAWGAEIALERLLSGMPDGVDSTVLLLEDGPMADRYRAAGARVQFLRVSPEAVNAGRQLGAGSIRVIPQYVRLLARLRRLIVRGNYDLVVGNTLKGSLLGSLATPVTGARFIWMARDRLSSDYVSGASATFFRSLLRVRAWGVVANSSATLSTLPSKRRSIVLHDPLSYAFFEPIENWSPNSDQPPIFGVFGRLAGWKGQQLFLQTFASRFRGTDARARIVGGPSGSDALTIEELTDLARRLGVSSQVTFVGHVDDVRSEYVKCTHVVHCSLIPEPFGQVIAEGLAMGCIVIAPNVGGPSELITHGWNGYLYDVGSSAALGDAMEFSLARSVVELEQIRVRGLRSVSSLAPDSVARLLLDFASDVDMSRGPY